MPTTLELKEMSRAALQAQKEREKRKAFLLKIERQLQALEVGGYDASDLRQQTAELHQLKLKLAQMPEGTGGAIDLSNAIETSETLLYDRTYKAMIAVHASLESDMAEEKHKIDQCQDALEQVGESFGKLVHRRVELTQHYGELTQARARLAVSLGKQAQQPKDYYPFPRKGLSSGHQTAVPNFDLALEMWTYYLFHDKNS